MPTTDNYDTLAPTPPDDPYSTRSSTERHKGGMQSSSLETDHSAPATIPQQPEMRRTIGNYRIEHEIGRGGMGTVFLATHQQFQDRQYALKLISGAAASPQSQQQFQREIEALAKSRHPNLLYAFDAGAHDSMPYIVTELVPGYDIGKLIRANGVLPISVACEIARQMALGLEFAHAKGIIHRDIKPQNVMLQPNGQVKILDLGLASVRGSAAQAPDSREEVVGTPLYMPPEQWLGHPAPAGAADIYSLGCTLFEMIAGRPPFPPSSHPTLAQQRLAHVEQMAPSLSDVSDRVPADVARLVARCLAKDPQHRPATCEEVATALEPHAAPLDSAQLFHAIPNHNAPDTAAGISYDTFAQEIRFPHRGGAGKGWFGGVLLLAMLPSLGGLALAYWGPHATEAWQMRFDRLGGIAVPPGTGFAIEALRALIYLSCVFLLAYSRFWLPIQRFFSWRLHTAGVWTARIALVVVLALFLGVEFRRHWYPQHAAAELTRWAAAHAVSTTPEAELTSYRYYMAYSMTHYVFIFGGLFLVPILQFLLSDAVYVRHSIQLFTTAQSQEPNAMEAVDRLYTLAQHFRRIATRYIDTAGVLSLGVQYEFWLGKWTLSEQGYLIEITGTLVAGGVMLAILCFVALNYATAIEATRNRQDNQDHRIEQHIDRLSLLWFVRTSFFSRLSGMGIVSLIPLAALVALRR